MWEKKGIILEASDLKADWVCTHVQLPVPLKIDSETLRIFFSARDRECHSHPLYLDVDINSFKVKRIQENPLLELGKWGSFDENGISFCSCMVMNDNLYMYYIGWNKAYKLPYKNAIGLAISNDGGNTFKKYSDGPIIDRSMDYPYFVASPFVMRQQGRFRMYLLSCTKWEYNPKDGFVPYYLIKSAVSKDGIRWEAEEGNRIEYKNLHEAIARPWGLFYEGRFYMWYSYRDTYDFRKNRNNTYMIGVAVSNDGLNWIRKDEEVGISKSLTGWDSEMMCYASIVEKEDKLIMIYNGNEHGKYAMGYAVCSKEDIKQLR